MGLDSNSFCYSKAGGRHRRDEVVGESRERCLADYHERRHSMTNYSLELVGLVANPPIMTDGDPTLLSNGLQPLIVRASRFEVIRMPLDLEAGGGKDVGELLAEVAIREENAIQAARSYKTACSISDCSRP